MIKNIVSFLFILLIALQISACVTYKVDASSQRQQSPSDRIDDVQRRNDDAFKELK